MDVHTICLIGGTTLYCLLAFYLLSSASLLHVALVDHLVCFRCTSPVDLVVVISPEFTTIGIRVKVNLKMSAIKFDIQKFDDIINFSK